MRLWPPPPASGPRECVCDRGASLAWLLGLSEDGSQKVTTFTQLLSTGTSYFAESSVFSCSLWLTVSPVNTPSSTDGCVHFASPVTKTCDVTESWSTPVH